MIWTLHRPSFWPESRDPWAWQRALQRLMDAAPVADPWPCWEALLKGSLSRRSVAGLYGLREQPLPPVILGMGLLTHHEDGWRPSEAAQGLLVASREDFSEQLATLLVRQSPWVRLALRGLASGAWRLPSGVAPLLARRALRVGHDLDVPVILLPEPSLLLGDLHTPQVSKVQTTAKPASLSSLHGPLYLLHTLGWLDAQGTVVLPDALSASLALESPAAILRRITADEQDGAGFVPFTLVARKLWHHLYGTAPTRLAAWADLVLGGAIEKGSIEVQSWAPGQPRHGRGLGGDRARKLVRWTIHDDFTPAPREP